MKRKIYHVQLRDPAPNEQEHTYFGSQKAIFNFYAPERLGIKYQSLYSNYNLSKQDYNGKKCIIRMGFLHTFRDKPEDYEQR